MIQDRIVFCTYFNKNFLLKGLALHASLTKHNPEAELWILAFDKYTEDILSKMKLKGVKIIPLEEFEDRELLSAKGTRNMVEYYWTCTPSLPLYIFKKSPSTRYVCYLDADLYFYSQAGSLLTELDGKSILAVEHRFPKGRESIAKESGRFNVAVNLFKNDRIGTECLKRWRRQCIDWCYWRYEDGKLGDQMYLDEWPDLYKENLVISKNLGVDAAPWNISQYKVSKKGGFTYIDSQKLICYHFHQFQILGENSFSRVLGYTLSADVVKHIYEPYEVELMEQYKRIKKFDRSYIIKPPETSDNKKQIFRQRLAKYFGPFYWKFKNIFVRDNI